MVRERGRRSLRGRAAALAVAVVLGTSLLAACDPVTPLLTGTLSLADGAAAPAGTVVTLHADDTDAVVAQTTTDGDGRYRLDPDHITAGTYRVRFGDGSWWEGASSWADARSVALVTDETTTIDATVAAPDASLRGTVTSWYGRPVGGVTVEARSLDDSILLAQTTTGPLGSFVFDGLSTTGHALRFSAPGYATTWFEGAAAAPGATPVEPATGAAVPDLDVTMAPASRLSGSIRGPSDPSGFLAVAAEVGTGTWVGSALADSRGSFTIDHLPAGSYTVGVVDSNERFGTAVIGSTSGLLADGTPFTVEVGRTTSVGEIAVRGADCPADSRGADLTAADLAGARLMACDFTGARLDGADLSGADLTGATFSSAQLVGADLSGADLDRALLFMANAGGADLVGASTEGLNVRGANLAGADFGTDPLGAITSGSVIGIPTRLPAGWTVDGGFVLGPRAVLTRANLANRDLSGRDLRGADLSNATLTGASLAGADLTGARLPGAELTGANVSGSELSGATLRSVSSGGLIGVPASLPGGWVLHAGRLFGERVVVTGVDVDGADLSAADLVGITSGGLTGTPAALPTGWALVDGFLFGPAVVVHGADVDGADLSGVAPQGIRATGLTGTPTALPAGWLLHGGNLVGRSARLQNATLTGLDAPGIDLAGANLSGADLAGADLSGATLTNVFLTRTNLTGADLTGADLTAANLGYADLTGAHLSGATILLNNSGGLVGAPASLPPRLRIVGGFLLAPGAHLPGADLGGADLSGLDLTGAVLLQTDLTSADLTGTTLVGAELRRADLTGATVTGADLRDAVLDEVVGEALVGVPALLPAGWDLIDGVLVGPHW